jgi:hypothetical protein
MIAAVVNISRSSSSGNAGESIRDGMLQSTEEEVLRLWLENLEIKYCGGQPGGKPVTVQ